MLFQKLKDKIKGMKSKLNAIRQLRFTFRCLKTLTRSEKLLGPLLNKG